MDRALDGKRILVVEDEYFIAFDLKRTLDAQGAVVVGPVGDLAQGLLLAGDEKLDAAILDVNLRGTLSYPIADRLAAGQVPYMFLTGYDGWSLPAIYGARPRLAKPFSTPRLVRALEALCAERIGEPH
ncbi:MAG TPA: response regulator [Sphingobium sp.]|nr:response regulator [Sphingobium sp.]